MAITPEDFGTSFKGFLDQMQAQKAPEEAPFFVRKLRDHFGADPAGLPVIADTFAGYEHPNVHLAVEHYAAQDGRSAEVFGVTGQGGFGSVGLADLVVIEKGYRGNPDEGPVQYVNVTLDDDRVLTCVQRGLFLIREGERRVAIYARPEDKPGVREDFLVEVMADDRAGAERCLLELRRSMRARDVYRGHVISLKNTNHGDWQVEFHRLPRVDRGSIILPAGLLDRVERQTIEFSRQGSRLLAAGRHLKRGLLLHGAPGTGKTMTVMYLAAAMRDRTVLLMTGRNLGLVGRTCAMARALQPSIVVLEDVDLIAEDRTTKGGACTSPLLFELLNEMDGLAEDCDILFLLTSNRPELLEPALAARPGRVDQAIEVPLPDAPCRERLFDLYGTGLTMQVVDRARFVARTEGASAAFIRELFRRAALFAAEGTDELVVEDRHLDEALHDLVVRGGELTKSLLGFKSGVGFGAGEAAEV